MEDDQEINGETVPVKIKLDFKEDEPEDLARIIPKTRSTDWLDVDKTNKWFTEPAHLNLNGTRKSEDMDSSAVEDYMKSVDRSAVEEYLKSVDKMDNIRSSIDTLRRDLDLSELRDDLNLTRRKLRDDLELSRSYRLAAEDLAVVRASALETRALDTHVWSEPRLSSSASSPYRDYVNTLRLRSLRLEEERLLEIRRLQELERLRGPQPKWYELKTPQFHKEARKNNELLAAKRQWNELRDYTESVWRSRDLSRSATHL